MRLNKEIIMILVLASLLLSAIGAALYLYYEHENTKAENRKTVTVYVAKENLKKGQLIRKENIAQMQVQRKYILTKPLLLNDVVNQYAIENIYKNETFRKEKLASKIEETAPKVLPYLNNSYNMGFKLFKNPNYALQKGDLIKIASVYPRSKRKDNMSYKVRYVANNIKIIGFLEKGKHVENPVRIEKQQIKSKKKTKETKPKFKMVPVFADELLLDMPSATLLELLSDYNKGEQLWMAKANKDIKKIVEKPEVKKPVAKKAKKRVYNFVMYTPKNTAKKETATIEYLDKKVPRKSSSATVINDLKKVCQATTQYLVGISNRVYLRSQPKGGKNIKRTVYRNTILPYVRKVNDSWYEVCDGSYVHAKESTPISKQKVEGILSGQHKAK